MDIQPVIGDPSKKVDAVGSQRKSQQKGMPKTKETFSSPATDSACLSAASQEAKKILDWSNRLKQGDYSVPFEEDGTSLDEVKEKLATGYYALHKREQAREAAEPLSFLLYPR